MADRLAGCGIVRVTRSSPHLKFRGDRMDVDEVAGNQQPCHGEYPMLVMRHGDQPGGRRERRGDGCS